MQAQDVARPNPTLRRVDVHAWPGVVVLRVVSALVMACLPTLERPVGDVAIRNESARHGRSPSSS